MNRYLFGLVVCLSTLILSQTVQAGMIGDTINASGYSMTPAAATIDTTVEFTGINGFMDFDFDEGTLEIRVADIGGGLIWGGFGLYEFTAFDDVITSITLDTYSGWDTRITAFLTTHSYDTHSRMEARHLQAWTHGLGLASLPPTPPLSQNQQPLLF